MTEENIESPTLKTVPVIGSDAIDILLHDHQRIKAILRTLIGASESNRQAMLESLAEILTVHNATEETLIYPAIHELARRPLHSGELYRETAEAAGLLWRLTMTSVEDPSFADKATELQRTVDAHIRTEEDSEFPHLRDRADPDSFARISSAVRTFRDRFR
jgi:hemerythrin superfamily protein